MSPKDSNDCVVTVTIELGHTANFLKEPSLEGFTHDWTVFVRGKDGSKIEHFVEKVVFKLHKTFKCPTRAISVPPYKVNESGYAGFLLPIEIHFKNKQVPKKIFFSYDLFLNAKDHPPINNSRYEKLKFSNPTPEFKAKLIKAGGVEQGLHFEQPLPYAISPPTKTKKSKFGKKSKEGSQEKKKKKKHKLAKEASPAPSLSSLSSLSSSDEDDEIKTKHSSHNPPSFFKKEKEPAKKDSISSSQNKSETVSALSLNKKSKHKESSHSTALKDKPEKEPASIKHKSKDKDREKEKHVSAHKSDKAKKLKDNSSLAQKLSKEVPEAGYHQESPPQSNKSLLSSSSEKKSAPSSQHYDSRDKSSSSSKENSSSHHKEKHSSHKSKESSSTSSKGKHSSSHKHLHDATPRKHEHPEKKSKERERDDKKAHKRSSEVLPVEEETERKKMKSSSSSIDDDKSTKLKTSQVKNKDADIKHIEKDSKAKESSPKDKDKESAVVKKEKKETPSLVKKEKNDHSLSSKKHKVDKEKEKHLDKLKHSKEKHKDLDGSNRHKDVKKEEKTEVKKEEKPVKSAALLETEHLAMTADFQPRLLISPLERDPHSDSASDDSSSETKPKTEQKPKMKRTFSNSSVSSVHKVKGSVIKQEAQFVSGLTDSDGDSEDKEVSVSPKVNSPGKDVDLELVKAKHRKAGISSEAIKKSKHGDENVRKVSTNVKSGKESFQEDMSDEDEDCFANADAVDSDNEVKKSTDEKGLDILAPNGISLRDLIEINEKIEKASDNTKMLEQLVYLVGETDEFDLDETSFYFDICSLEKSVVKKIQTLLKAH